MDSQTITEIVKILACDSIAVEKWKELHHRLGVSMDIEILKNKRNIGLLSSFDLFKLIIEQWRSERGSKATVNILCHVLENIQFIHASQKIRQAFTSNAKLDVHFMYSEKISKIVEILSHDHTVLARWLELVDQLGLSMNVQYLKIGRNNGTLRSIDLFKEIIDRWWSERGSEASVEMLCQALEQMKCYNASHKIQAALNMKAVQLTEPIFFGFERISKNFTGRQKQLDETEKMLLNDNFVKIIGMGGIGKTELAKKFAALHKEWNCIWLDAENAETLKTSVTNFCESLGVRDGKVKFSDLFRSCLKAIKDENSFKVLVIVDNVDADYDEAFEVVSIIQDQQNCCAIVTSRNVGVMNYAQGATINLETLDSQESTELVRSSLEGESEQDIVSLCEQLDNFPLALQQAVAFIKQKQSKGGLLGNCFKISHYLEHYDCDKKRLLNFPLHKLEHRYSKTTLITWQTSIEVIKAEGAFGNIAINLLNIIAYMEPNDIPLEFIQAIYDQCECPTNVNEAIELLIAYSLVRFKSGNVSIHSLVQEVRRINLGNDETLIKLITAIDKLEELGNLKSEYMKHCFSAQKYFSQRSPGIMSYSHIL